MMIKRRNSINADEYLLKDWAILSRQEYQELNNQFRKTQQREGGISFYDLINILKTLGFNIDQKKRDQINNQLKKKQIKIIDSNAVLTQAAALKKQRQQSGSSEVHERNQYLDAFVALGGAPDKGGYVKKSVLVDTLKKQFQLTFDIEALIDGFSGDSLDYASFSAIFEHDKQKGEGRLASAASAKSLRTQGSQKSLELNDKDFQKFLQEHENYGRND